MDLSEVFFRKSLQPVSWVAQSCPTLCNHMNSSTSGLPVHHQLPESTQKLMSIELVMPSNYLLLCHPLLLLPSSFSFNISPSNEHPGLISFRMDWLDLLAVQGTLKSLFQHHSSKASILQLSAFFTVQLSNPYMTTGKTIALTRRIFVDKVMSLLTHYYTKHTMPFTLFNPPNAPNEAALLPSLYR